MLLGWTTDKPGSVAPGSSVQIPTLPDRGRGVQPQPVPKLLRSFDDVAFLRVEPNFDLEYRVVTQELLLVLMPPDHRLATRKSIRPQEDSDTAPRYRFQYAGSLFIRPESSAVPVSSTARSVTGPNGSRLGGAPSAGIAYAQPYCRSGWPAAVTARTSPWRVHPVTRVLSSPQ